LGKNQIGTLGLVRFCNNLAGKFKITSFSAAAKTWQYGLNSSYSLFYGADKDSQFWRRELEDTEDFRW
jgi:hypothetical protein